MSTPRLDRELSILYARALVAITRGDGEISTDEARRLQRQLDERCAWPIALDELLLDAPLSVHQLSELAVGSDPFRAAAVDTRQLAAMLVADGIAVVMTKGFISSGEAAKLRAFASALGLPDAEFARLTSHVAGWISTD